MCRLIAVVCMLLAVGCVAQRPAVRGVRLCTVIGDSMAPALVRGESEYAVDYEAELGDVRVGQIVVYWNGRKLVCHRVVGLVTKGDANKRPDVWPVTEDNFEGIVTEIVRSSGYGRN